MTDPKSIREVKRLYDQGANIMKIFHDMEPGTTTSMQAILVSYDLQAGSYIKYVSEHEEFVNNYMGTLAKILGGLQPYSLLEAGVGEATTLVNVLKRMDSIPIEVYGFDISWSRVACGLEYAAGHNIHPNLFVGNVMEVPLQDDSFDVVYTSHTIESNRGREKAILAELYRVARRYVVLLEPSNELGNEQSKRHIEEFKYCLDLRRHATELGFKVLEHRLYDYHWSERNQTSLMVIEKGMESQPGRHEFYACPICKQPITLHKGSYFCPECFVVFPVIGAIPCLVSQYGILASKYLEKA